VIYLEPDLVRADHPDLAAAQPDETVDPPGQH
jgi:hypothetical protein